MKKIFAKIAATLPIISLVGGMISCGGTAGNDDVKPDPDQPVNPNPDNPNPDKPDPDKPDPEIPSDPKTPEELEKYFPVGSDYKRLPNIKTDISNTVFDGFKGPLNRDKWAPGTGYWGKANGGINAKNVRVTDDGYLVLKAHGDNYAVGDVPGVGELSDGRRVGSAIISKFTCKPGHYDIRMKVAPRLGACTAFWTFAWKQADKAGEAPFNSELDIELPGGSNTGDISLDKCINTNWTTERAHESYHYAASDVTDSIAFNDGEFHNFGFDWYTNPGVIVYHVDGKISHISTVHIPNLESRLNIGVWFPLNWAGDPNFEEDQMIVDYVKYEPFKDQPIDPFDPGIGFGQEANSAYNDVPITLQESNKISNGNFEYYTKIDKSLAPDKFRNQMNNRGWTFGKTVGKSDFTDEELSNIQEGAGIDNTCAAFIRDKGVLRQEIDSVFEGYKYTLKFSAKTKLELDGKDPLSKLVVRYLDKGKKIIEGKDVIIPINNLDSYKEYTKELVAPTSSRTMRIEARTVKGNILYLDNMEMVFHK